MKIAAPVSRPCKPGFQKTTLSVAALVLVALTASPVLGQSNSVLTSPSGIDGGLASFADRLDRIERDIRALNMQVARGVVTGDVEANRPSLTADELEGPAAARMSVRLNALEVDLRQATGSIEELSFQMRQLSQRFDKLVTDLDYRLSRLDGGAPLSESIQPTTAMPTSPRQFSQSAVDGTTTQSLAPVSPTTSAQPGPVTPGTPSMADRQTKVLGTISQEAANQAANVMANTPAPSQDSVVSRPTGPTQMAAPVSAEAAPPPATPQAVDSVAEGAGPLPAGSPRDQYAHAFRLLRQADYDQAETALSAFLQAHPEDPLAANATYWLGETFYVREEFVKAAEVFLDGYKSHPKGPKAPDTLLKLGMTLTALDKKEQACATFGKLLRDYSDASETIKETTARERTKANCS